MRAWIPPIAAGSLVMAVHGAHATPLPPGIAAVIHAAAEDPEGLKAVVKATKRAYPASAAEIDAQATALADKAPNVKAEEIANPGLFAGWKAKGEFGASVSTGNSNDRGFSASLAIDKQSPRWNHDLNVSADHKSEDNKTKKDRYFGAYSLQRVLSPRFYAVGVLWGERDRFAGYNFRIAESLGLGYRLFNKPDLKLRVEAGAALRQAEYLGEDSDTDTVAARAAGYLTWKITPGLEFGQSLVTYVEKRNPTLLAATSLTTKLSKRLSARGTYEVRYEADPPGDRRKVDTGSRLTVIFDF